MNEPKRRSIFSSRKEEIVPEISSDDVLDSIVGDVVEEEFEIETPLVEEQTEAEDFGIEDEELEELELENVNGWERISDDQKDGNQIIVSAKPEGEGILAYWRKTRKLENFKWVDTGKWSDPMTNQTLHFEPNYFKPVHSEVPRG